MILIQVLRNFDFKIHLNDEQINYSLAFESVRRIKRYALLRVSAVGQLLKFYTIFYPT